VGWVVSSSLDSLIYPTDCLLSTPRPVIDREERIISMLAGKPRDPTWTNVESNATGALHEGGKQASFSQEQRMHRRGDYPALGVGVSFGGGRRVSAAFLWLYASIHVTRPQATFAIPPLMS
jgi:hypothetical protein